MYSIKKLVIPDTVRYLGVTAVNGNVVSYMDPNGTTGTFEGMTDLVHVLLPKNDNFIGIPNYTFAGCNKIEAIRIPASVKYIGKNAFGYSSLVPTSAGGIQSVLKDIMICGNPDISQADSNPANKVGVFGYDENSSLISHNIYSSQAWKNTYFNSTYHYTWPNGGPKWHLYNPSGELTSSSFQDFGSFINKTLNTDVNNSVKGVNLDEKIQTYSNAGNKLKEKQIRKMITVGTGTSARIYACGHYEDANGKNKSIVMRFFTSGEIDPSFGDTTDTTNPTNNVRTGTLTLSLIHPGSVAATAADYQFGAAGDYDIHQAYDIIEVPNIKDIGGDHSNRPSVRVAICGTAVRQYHPTNAANNTVGNATAFTAGYVAVIDCDIVQPGTSTPPKFGRLWSYDGQTNGTGWGSFYKTNAMSNPPDADATRYLGYVTYQQYMNATDYQDSFFADQNATTPKGINRRRDTGALDLLDLSYGSVNDTGKRLAFRNEYDSTVAMDLSYNPASFMMNSLFAPHVRFYNIMLVDTYDNTGAVNGSRLSVIGTTSIYKMEQHGDGYGGFLIKMLPVDTSDFNNGANRRDALIMMNFKKITGFYNITNPYDIMIRKINYADHLNSYSGGTDVNTGTAYSHSNWGYGMPYGMGYGTNQEANGSYADLDTSISLLHPNFTETIAVFDNNSPMPDFDTTRTDGLGYKNNYLFT